jgi:hypothetical protein
VIVEEYRTAHGKGPSPLFKGVPLKVVKANFPHHTMDYEKFINQLRKEEGELLKEKFQKYT